MESRRVPLDTGVTLNVALAGDATAPPVILLHGFPESHRTWREVAPRLEDRFRLVMPDQRGFAGSDRPQEVDAYNYCFFGNQVGAVALGSSSSYYWESCVTCFTTVNGDLLP